MHFIVNEIEIGIKILKKVRKVIKTKNVGESVLENLDPLLKAGTVICNLKNVKVNSTLMLLHLHLTHFSRANNED
jgi:hypothetical protein